MTELWWTGTFPFLLSACSGSQWPQTSQNKATVMENSLKKFLWTIKTSGLIKGNQQLSPTATFTQALRAKGPDDAFTLMFIWIYVILRETSTKPSYLHRWGSWASLSAHLSKYLCRNVFLCSACVKQLCTKGDRAQLWNECVCSLSPH